LENAFCVAEASIVGSSSLAATAAHTPLRSVIGRVVDESRLRHANRHRVAAVRCAVAQRRRAVGAILFI